MERAEQLIARMRRIAAIKPQIKSALDALCTTLAQEAAGEVADAGADMAAWADMIAARDGSGEYTFHEDADLGTVVDSRIPYEDRAWNRLGFASEPAAIKAGFTYAVDYIVSRGGVIPGVHGTRRQAARISGPFSSCGMDLSRTVFFPGPSMLDTSGVTDWQGAFADNRTLLEMGERLDVSGARYEVSRSTQPCARMFLGCRSLKTLPEMDFEGIRLETGIDSSQRSLFAGCVSLEDAGGLRNYGASESVLGHQFNALFAGCTRLTRLPSIDWSHARQLVSTFSGNGFSELDMGGWDLSGVTSMQSALEKCAALRRVVWPKCPMRVTDIRGLLSNCTALEEVDMRGFDTSGVTAMDSAFYGMTALRVARLGDLGSLGRNGVSRLFDRTAEMEAVGFHGRVEPEALLAILQTVPARKAGQAALRVGLSADNRLALEASAVRQTVEDLCRNAGFHLYDL